MLVAEAFSKATVQDLNGQNHPMNSLWAEQPAVILFLRHFGCMFCQDHIKQAVALHGEFLEHGTKFYAIGHGTVEQAKAFVEANSVPFPVYCDPTKKIYDLAGFKRGFGIGLGSLRKARALMKEGKRPGAPQGDPKQQGGALVILPGGDRVWSHRDKFVGDVADLRKMLSAVRLSDNKLDGAMPATYDD